MRKCGIRTFVRIFFALFVLSVTIWVFLENAGAEERSEEQISDRYGLAVALGNGYDPGNDINFFMLTGLAIYDYDRIWPHRAPENLRFKMELSAGVETFKSRRYATASFSVFALYYLCNGSDNLFKPYLEGGIGGIYTDYRVEGQGLKLNFNPQFGFGAEFKDDSDRSYFASLRLHHISNSGLHEDNRGVNSVFLLLGLIF